MAADPGLQRFDVTPVLSGALGLVLALSLGVDAKLSATTFWGRLKQVFEVPGLLRVGAVTYLISALFGGVVWGIQGDTTPALVTSVVLTVAGYAAAAVTALARG